jgi:hypothetical protein
LKLSNFIICYGPVLLRENSRRADTSIVMDDILEELLRSHAERRGALIFAARRINKLNFGRKQDRSPPVLRFVIREARRAATRAAITKTSLVTKRPFFGLTRHPSSASKPAATA